MELPLVRLKEYPQFHYALKVNILMDIAPVEIVQLAIIVLIDIHRRCSHVQQASTLMLNQCHVAYVSQENTVKMELAKLIALMELTQIMLP